MVKFVFALVFLFVVAIWGIPLINHEGLSGLLNNLVAGGIGAILGYGIKAVADLKERTWTCLLANFRYRNTHIRVSIAYLFKIYLDGKYLLVKGRNIDQFQPVGGVFKWLPESSGLFGKLEVKDDKEILICDTTRFDLRVRVKGRFLYRFLQWFDSREGREISHWREFCEELFQPGHVSRDNFPHIDYKFLHRNPFYIHYSQYYQCPEILIHEVYELLPSQNQLAELKKLNPGPDSCYQWFDEDTIKRLGRTPSGSKPFVVAEHANTLFNKEYKVK